MNMNYESLPKKKILEVCPYSSGICGVWNRVQNESLALTGAGYNVRIISSNFIKGDNTKLAEDYSVMPGWEGPTDNEDDTEDIEIFRYPGKKLGGESFMDWLKNGAVKEAIEFKPDAIIVHNYRHLHTTAALGIANELKKNGHKCKVFLVTHAPFIEGNTTRSLVSSIVVNFYDKLMGPRTINKFDKVITISKWEDKYWDKIGCDKNKRAMIPNGLPIEFFEQPFSDKIPNTVLFLGRVSPIKNVETLLEAAILLPKIQFSIVGPIEDEYMKELNSKFPNFPKNVTFYGAISEIHSKIEAIDKHRILVLPSLREAMPQVILEGMSRGKIVIASKTEGALEMISDNDDGLLFEIGNAKQLSDLIEDNLYNKEHIQMNAAKKAEKYYWGELVEKYISLIEE